ncbi:hypothetical protein EDB83DRAFT_2407741 [Lactarius deliciosus]|nr:hypothetical protein EDB83DRAFT_2407741 [Lactarius deliciosus]
MAGIITVSTANAGSGNIGQFERNPYLETTTRARLNPNHVDECIRIVEVTAKKIPQTVHWQYISRWGWVGPDVVKSSGRVSRGKLSTVAITAIVILLDRLQQMIWSDICVEKGSTHWKKIMCLCRGWKALGNSYIPMHAHVWIFWIRWWGRVIVCWIVIWCDNVVWILHFILLDHVSQWLRDSFLPMDVLLIITGDMRVHNTRLNMAVCLVERRKRECICWDVVGLLIWSSMMGHLMQRKPECECVIYVGESEETPVGL